MISIWEYEEGLQVARRHKGELPEPAFAGQIVPGDVHPGALEASQEKPRRNNDQQLVPREILANQ